MLSVAIKKFERYLTADPLACTHAYTFDDEV